MAQPALSAMDLLAWSPPGWGGALMGALLTSLKVAVGGYAMGLVLGMAGAIGKLHGGRFTRDLLAIYTTLVRAIPELVLIVLLYYAGTDLLNRIVQAMGAEAVDVSGLVTGILVIGIVQGAYCTEVLRGAILAVPTGQVEAARAYGMSPLQAMRRVVLPAMLPHALPGLSNLWLIATKDTALLAVVGFAELTLVTRQAAGVTKAYFLFFGVAGLLYLAITLVSSAGSAARAGAGRRWMPGHR